MTDNQIIRIPYKYGELINTMSDENCWKLMKAIFSRTPEELTWLNLTYYNIIIVDIQNIEMQVNIWKKSWILGWRPKQNPPLSKNNNPPLLKTETQVKLSKDKLSKEKINKDKLIKVVDEKTEVFSPPKFEELIKEKISPEIFIKEYNTNQEYIMKQLKNFYYYWTEKKPNWKKEKWEMEKTFDISRRFHTWLANSNKWSKDFKNNKWAWITIL